MPKHKCLTTSDECFEASGDNVKPNQRASKFCRSRLRCTVKAGSNYSVHLIGMRWRARYRVGVDAEKEMPRFVGDCRVSDLPAGLAVCRCAA